MPKQKDLFGKESEYVPPKKATKQLLKGAQRMYVHYGKIEGKKCKGCTSFVRKEFAKTYFKCEWIGTTANANTDIRANGTACGKYKEKEETTC